ncbi:MAG: DNA polymerase I [Bacteroidaceae bacterium]|nr:DNA polymerase I [Bacteroidaceae bacterium]
MKKLFLLDAYALIYRAYYGFINRPLINSKGNNTSAIFGFVKTLEEVLTKENPDYIGVAFDVHGPTFRHEAFPEYKAQREETPDGIKFGVPIIKEILRAYNIPVIERFGYEADDVIGTLATQGQGLTDTDIYMMTPDKDYGQLVHGNVKMYKPRHDGGFDILSEQDIIDKYGIERTSQVIDLLGLMGDSSDNFPGCPGVGEKTAVKLIKEFGSVENLLANTDKLKGAIKTKVETHVDDIKMSLFLAKIKTDIPDLTLNLEELQRQAPNQEALQKIFEEHELRSLIKKKESSTPPPSEKATVKSAKKSKVAAGQLDIFAQAETAIPQAQTLDLFAASRTENQKKSVLSDFRTTKAQYQLVDSLEAMRNLAAKLLTAKEFALDTETASWDKNDKIVDPMKAELVGLSFAMTENEAYYIPVPAEKEQALIVVNVFKEVYNNEDTLKIGHNIKYDMIVLKQYGIDIRGKLFDTMIADYVLMPERQHKMDSVAEYYLKYRTIHYDEVVGTGKQQKTMRDLDPADIVNYAAEDADVTLKLKHILEKELAARRLTQLFEDIEMPLVRVLMHIEMNGARIDTEALKETSTLFTQRMLDIESSIRQVAGQSLNISSPKQIGELLFDKLKLMEHPRKTKTGQYVTDEATLQALKSKHIVVEQILEYRGYKKLLSTYIDALPQLINQRTGHIHTSYNQAVTSTGRLSSSNPNLQNIPVRDDNGKEVRKAFIPDEGELFFSADYSQIELRLMAHLSGDRNMIEDFNSGHDIHRATAAKIFKCPIEAVTSDMRRKAKTANFGIIYGISAFGLAERMDVSRTEAKELIDEYFATYPGVKAYMEASIEKARRLKYTETLYGRQCQVPGIDEHNAVVRGYAERNAINAPIQGTAADIIKIAMIRIDQRLQAEGLRSKMILQVHDELNFSVVPEERERLQDLVITEMQNVCHLSVPLIADCGWGKNWLEAH